MVLLTTMHPNVRIPHKIKIAVESEAIVHAGKMKSSTALYRIIIQKLYPDASFWKEKASTIIEKNKDLIDASISKVFIKKIPSNY